MGRFRRTCSDGRIGSALTPGKIKGAAIIDAEAAIVELTASATKPCKIDSRNTEAVDLSNRWSAARLRKTRMVWLSRTLSLGEEML
jgi:hypothetical protein